MRLLGLEITRAKQSREIAAKTEYRPAMPQGMLTPYFGDLYLRKVSGDFYEALREGIPIFDSAIRRLISLNGTIKVIGDNAKIVKELEDFNRSVPVNDHQQGIHAFLENASNETFEQGFALPEFIATRNRRDIAGLMVPDSKQITYRKNSEGRTEPWYRQPGTTTARTYSYPQNLVQNILTASYGQTSLVGGMYETKLDMRNKLYFSINNENNNPYGVSVMRSCEFVSKVLATMQNSTLNVWERFGDPSFQVKYKTKNRVKESLDARRQQLSTDFNNAIRAKRAGKSADFVTAVDTDSDIEVAVIGHDNQVLEIEMPARHMLEQIVAKVNLPAWMLGIYWSTTERMATLEVEAALQDAKIRQLAMLPQFIRLYSVLLAMRGFTWKTITDDVDKPGDWGIIFETPNLRDLVAQAQARFLNAQADQMESNAMAPGTQTTVTVGQTSVTIPEKKGAVLRAIPCGCGKEHGDVSTKEIFRTTPWPKLDSVEDQFENELKYDWNELRLRVLEILKLPDTDDKAAKAFTFSQAQRDAVFDALKTYLGYYDPKDPDSTVRWYYGQAYSLGLLQAAELVGKEQPILDIIKNQEVFDTIASSGFQLVKNNATTAIKGDIIPEIELLVSEGAGPRAVAERLNKLFGDKNSDWERLARSEMTLAAERAKLDEWKEWDIKTVDFVPAPDACPICTALAGTYPIGKAPLPVADTHPRCRCGRIPAAGEG